MNELQIFNSPEFGAVRTVTIDHEPWFVGKDVAQALGYTNPQKAVGDHVDEEDQKMGERNVTPSITDNLGREQYPVFINESGLYALIFGSKLESARKFKKWVCSDVLPSLRKTGTYTMPELRELEDKCMLFDRLTGGHTNKNLRDSAKALDITQSQFVGWLLNSGMVYRNDAGEILPTSKYENTGFFKVVSYRNRYSYHEGHRTLVTPTGLTAFAGILDAAGLNRRNLQKYGGRKGGNFNRQDKEDYE